MQLRLLLDFIGVERTVYSRMFLVAGIPTNITERTRQTIWQGCGDLFTHSTVFLTVLRIRIRTYFDRLDPDP